MAKITKNVHTSALKIGFVLDDVFSIFDIEIMNIALTKLELAKQLLNTNDKDIINHIKAVFSTQNENWWEELPSEVKLSIEKGLKESESGQTIPHEQVMKRYKKWLKK